jgi:hypothetical protein
VHEPLLRDAVRDAAIVEKEATWFYRDFTGMPLYVRSELLNPT